MSFFPIRCFTCGKCIAQYIESYEAKIEENIPEEKILDDFKIDRECCRRMFMTHNIKLGEYLMKYDTTRIVDLRTPSKIEKN